MIINNNTYDNPGFIIDYNAASSLCSIRKLSNPPVLNRKNNFLRQQPMSNGGNLDSFDVKYKILLLGDTQVGKTSLQRFAAGKNFRPDIGSTIGVDFVSKIVPVEGAKVNLQIWDTAGQKNFRTIGKSHYGTTQAFVLVYDVTNEETFRLIEEFNHLIEQAGFDMERRYLVGNKVDLSDNRKVDEDVGQRFASRHSMMFFETSCKTGENISDLLEQIASDLIRQYNPKELESHKPVKDNFVFNYQTSSTTGNEILDTNNNNNNQSNKKPKKKTKVTTSLSYDQIDKDEGFNFRRLLFCCNPRKTTNTID